VSRLLRSNLTVAAGTTLSRVTGLLRVVALTYVLGQTALTDAYSLANETPNIVYELLLGGVLSATLVPLFATFDEDDDERATNVVLSVSVVLMLALTVIAVVAAPLIFRVYAIHVGPDVDPDVFRTVGTTLARIFLIQILFYGLVGLANAFLNSRRRFFAAAWSPILPNVIIIATLLSLPNAGSAEWVLDDVLSNDRLKYTLGLGATLGIASMALVLVPAMFNTGFKFRPVFEFRHPAVGRLLRLSFWTIGFVAANQISLIVIRNLAEPGEKGWSKWTDAVPTSVEIIPVQLPGREARIADQPFVRLAPLLSELAEAMVPHLGVPFALFGHSMGALICFELARYLRRAFGASPVHLFLSAAPAPQMQRRHRAMHDLPTEELLEELRRLDGTPNEVLRSDEVMHLLLPALRADLTLIETYSYFPDAPLACPISVFGGLNDARVTPAEIAAWREHGSGPFTQRMVPGGHFFAYDPRGPVAESIISELVRVAGVIP